MTSDHRDLAGSAVDPELVAALAGSQVLEAAAAQAGHHVPVFQCRHPARAGTGIETGNGRLKVLVLRLKTRRSAGGSGSFSERYTSMRMRAFAWPSSIVSARVRPCTTRPGRSGLVARNPPSARASSFTFNRTSVSIEQR